MLLQPPLPTPRDEADMRIIFSVLALLLVAAVVMKLTATQTRVLVPAGSTVHTPGAGSAPPAAARVIEALEQGAARRAAEAASQ